jgi:hypothetical protein
MTTMDGLNSVNYYRQVFSPDDWAIGLESNDKEYLTRRFWSFWNWKATSGKLDWWTDTFAVFWTDEERFRQAVLDISRTRVLQDIGGGTFKGQKGGVDYLAYDLRDEFMTEIKDEIFYTKKMRTIDSTTHAELQISAENLSDWDARKA